MTRRYLHVLLTALIVSIAASSDAKGEEAVQDDAVHLLDLPVLPGTEPEKESPTVDVTCSETIPSIEIATLTWRLHDWLHKRQRLDVTVYANGFDQDRYATLWPLRPGQRPRALRTSKLRSADPALIPRLKSIDSDRQQGSVTVTLEGLAGGLIYDVRLATLKDGGWVPEPAARVEAPICITEQEAPPIPR